MNTKHILDLTLRLSQALDQNYDVVNMDTVLSVISALEGTTITKEQLETTRLAKYINQLRRRTRCENLARRAKSLLKRWREMVGMQQTNDTSAPASIAGYVPPSTAITSSSTTTNTLCNMPVSDNAVSNSHLTNPQFSHQQYQIPQQCQINAKQDQIQQQLPYRSEPSSPVNLQEKSNPNEFIISISNPAAGPQVPKSSATNTRKKRKLEKNISNETITQQPTSFANLLTGLGNTFATSRKSTRDKAEPETSTVKPVETFIIEHSSNSNSDLICIPSNNTVNSNFTSATDVPPVVIDLQDTNSSMNSLVSKDVTNVSSTSYRNKVSTKKAKKEKKRKDRNTMLRQNQPLQDCDDQNATTTSYQNKQPTDVLLLDEKSHSVCPTLSNISEILSLSNSSMSSVFPSADAMSKNMFTSGQNELSPSSAKMNKSDLTFAGKFKQNTTSSTSTGCNIINYNNDSINTNAQTNNSLNQNKFSMFGTNSNDSSSSSRTSSFHDVLYAAKREASNSIQGMDGFIKNDVNEKSMSNMSNKGSSYTDNSFALGASAITGAQQQQQQSIDLTKEVSSQKVIKTPKKRGRKKGSKGVDSVIAKETSLSSQMLLTPLGVAGKKVKTTKELYAEMESRKLRNVKAMGIGEKPANFVDQQQPQTQKPVVSRCPSLSDIADTDSCTMTSEPSRDSGNIVNKAAQGKRETHLDNNSNYSKNDPELKTGDLKSDENSRLLPDESSVIETTAKIKLEIQEFLKLLRAPPSIKEIEHECFNSITPCTCTIEEVTVPAENETFVVSGDHDSKDSSLNATNSTNIHEKETKQLCIIPNEQIANASENVHLAEKSQQVAPTRPSPPPAKLKKSIFDLDFDDDEDPLNSIIADIEGKNFKTETEIKPISHEAIDDKIELPLKTEDDLGKVDHQNLPYALNVPNLNTDNIVFPSYEIKCDPNCEAKNRFEIQTQKITKFHVDTLHNCYIPNVNGNWSHANAIQLSSSIKHEDSSQKLNAVVDGYDVVPLYGSDMNEQIAKDLSHVKFSKKYNAKHSKRPNSNEVLFHIPFLGVSRIPDIDDTKPRSKDVKKLSSDDEKENVDYKSNLGNILLNASALDAEDAKEKLEMEGSEHIVEKSSINSKLRRNKNRRKRTCKRTRRRETFIKRSTIKRNKLDVNETLLVNTGDSNDFHNTEELKLHKSLFYHDELYAADKNDINLSNECIFNISSCSSSCSIVNEDGTNERLNCRSRLDSTSSSSSSSESEYHVLNLQREIFQSELKKRSQCATENSIHTENDLNECLALDSKEAVNKKAADDGFLSCDDNDLPIDNNHMLLSFNNIYKKSTRDENAEQNKDHENNMLKQQLQNCDDYNNLNNFNLIKYIENKNSSVNNINNNNNNSCSNNNSETNINISSSGSENPNNPAFTNHHSNNDNDVQSRPFKEYQTGMRAVDEDVNDDDGNNCGRLQQFKEWHEVLQLRSYNDELLTVLPYVVLD